MPGIAKMVANRTAHILAFPSEADTRYVGTPGGIDPADQRMAKSLSGRIWYPQASEPLPILPEPAAYAQGAAASDDLILIPGSNGGLWRSEDGRNYELDTSFFNYDPGANTGNRPLAIAYNPDDGYFLCAGTGSFQGPGSNRDTGVWKSEDGENWEVLAAAPTAESPATVQLNYRQLSGKAFFQLLIGWKQWINTPNHPDAAIWTEAGSFGFPTAAIHRRAGLITPGNRLIAAGFDSSTYRHRVEVSVPDPEYGLTGTVNYYDVCPSTDDLLALALSEATGQIAAVSAADDGSGGKRLSVYASATNGTSWTLKASNLLPAAADSYARLHWIEGRWYLAYREKSSLASVLLWSDDLTGWSRVVLTAGPFPTLFHLLPNPFA